MVRRVFLVCACLSLAAGIAFAQNSVSDVKVGCLRCEYKAEPLGISETKPRLSWVLQSQARGQRQSGYQVVVASSQENLGEDVGNLWDTGKVASDASNQIEYGGRMLGSRQRCFWKVRVWDKDGKASAWSETATWTMGLLQRSDWEAKWIGYDAAQSAYTDADAAIVQLNDCKWMVLEKSQEGGGRGFFRGKVEIGPQEEMKRIRLVLAAGNAYSVFVNGKLMGTFTAWIAAPVIEIEGQLRTGENVLAISAADLDDPKLPAGIAGKIVIERYAAGPEVLKIDESWKAARNAKQGWQAEDFNDGEWTCAVVGKRANAEKWRKVEAGKPTLPPVPYLRKEFTAAGAVKRATVYASALGLYELHINGKRVGADYFTPGWTDYKKRVYYQTYDVTSMLRSGENAIGALLADMPGTSAAEWSAQGTATSRES